MAKRRLPVVASNAADEELDPKPHWQWVAFGAVATLVVWVPLAYLATRLSLRGADVSSAAVPLHALALGIAGIVGSYLVARYAPNHKRIVLLSALAPVCASSFAALLSLASAGWAGALSTVVLPFAFGVGWAGATLGRKGRIKGA